MDASGAELDALQRQYQSDFTAFSSFQESPMAKALLAVDGKIKEEAAAQGVKPNAGIMAALQQSVAHMPPRGRPRMRRGGQARTEIF